MAGIFRSAALFGRGIWLAVLAATAAITDPLDALKMTGFVAPGTEWLLGEAAMRAVFLAAAVVLAFWWYHRARSEFEAQRPALPDMPIHEAARWVAQHSEWAASLPSSADNRWVSLLQQEMCTKLSLGRLDSWGFVKQADHPPSTAPYDMDCRAWALGEFAWHKLVFDKPPHAFAYRDKVYRRVMLNRDQVMREWPSRSFFARMTGRSPIDRLNRSVRAGQDTYKDIWRRQDAAYASYLLLPAYSPFEECFRIEASERDNLNTDGGSNG